MLRLSIEPIDRPQWLELSAGFGDHNYRQCWDYGQLLAKRRKATSQHVAIRSGNDLIGLADVRIKRLPLLGGIAYISGGPLVRRGDGTDVDRLAACLKALRQYYVESRGLLLRIQGTLGEVDWNRRSTGVFAERGFNASEFGRPYRTLVVDIARPLAEVRSNLAQKWRNQLNKAERTNPAPKVSHTASDFDRFNVLFEQFRLRKGFSVDLDPTFFRQVQEMLPKSEAMTLTTVEVDGTLTAGHLSTALGDTCVYLLGATSDEALKSNAAHLLQWQVIKMAHEKGMKWYDLGGIDPVGNPGVYHFKSGLGGVEMLAPGPFDAIPNTIRARLVMQAERSYRQFRNRAKRESQAAKPVTEVNHAA